MNNERIQIVETNLNRSSITEGEQHTSAEYLPATSETKAAPKKISQLPHKDYSDIPHVSSVPAFKHVVSDKHTAEELATLANTYRCAVKAALEEGLRNKCMEVGGEIRICFKEVTDPNTGMHAFIKDLDVVYFPKCCIDYIKENQDYIHNNYGWFVIEQCGDTEETTTTTVASEEPLATCFHNIVDIVFDISWMLCSNYEYWIESKLGITDFQQVLSTDQMFQSLQYMLSQVSEIMPRIKQLIEEEGEEEFGFNVYPY